MNTPGHRGALHISEDEDDPVMVMRKMKEMKAELDSKINSLQTNIDILGTDVKTEITSVHNLVDNKLDGMKTTMDNKLDKLLALLRAPATPAPAAAPTPGTNPNQPTMVPSFIPQTEMERTVNMGNPVFQSYGFIAKQVEEALRERAEEDKFYNNTGAPRLPLTAGALQEKGFKQKKAFKYHLEKIVWNGQVPIFEWVQWICDALADHSLTSVTLKEQKNCIWGAIHPSRQQELTHIRPRTAAFIQDSLPEYIARITSVFEPEIFSEKYRQAYQNRKQSKQETATRYLASKWFH